MSNTYNASGFTKRDKTIFKSYNLNGCTATCIVQGLIKVMQYWLDESENKERGKGEREFAKEKAGDYERALHAFDKETMKGR